METTIYHLLWYFFIFMMVGWINDSIFISLQRKKITNSGVLFGPWCPIYGFGGLIIYTVGTIFAFNPFLLFVAVAILCSTLEYFTGYILEKFFHRRWWDYSKWPFNIKGYITLPASLYWGFLGLVVTYVIVPFIDQVLSDFSTQIGWIILIVLSAFFIFDVVKSAINLFDLRKRWREIRKMAGFELYKVNLRYEERLSELTGKLGYNQKRFLKSFPSLKRGFDDNITEAKKHGKELRSEN